MSSDPSEIQKQEEEQASADADFVRNSSGSSAGTAKVGAQSVETTNNTTVQSARGVALFNLINNGPQSAENVGNNTSVTTTQARSALNDLHDRNLIEVLLPEDASDGPIFGAVPRGENAAYQIVREQ